MGMGKGPDRLRDSAYLSHIRGQKCLVWDCNQPGDPHHLTHAQPRAMASKTGDQWVVPLCRHHHRKLHESGMSEDMWWTLEGIDPMQWAEEAYRSYIDGNQQHDNAGNDIRFGSE